MPISLTAREGKTETFINASFYDSLTKQNYEIVLKTVNFPHPNSMRYSSQMRIHKFVSFVVSTCGRLED